MSKPDKPDIMMASELIDRLQQLIREFGDLPVDLAVDYEDYDDAPTARGPLDDGVRYVCAADWGEEVYPKRFLLSSSGFLANLAYIPD